MSWQSRLGGNAILILSGVRSAEDSFKLVCTSGKTSVNASIPVQDICVKNTYLKVSGLYFIGSLSRK